MSNKIKSFSILTGGGADTLDAFPVASIGNNDFAFGIVNGLYHPYYYDASLVKAATESPDFIVPTDNASGTGAWVLTGSHVEAIWVSGSSISTGNSTKVIYNSQIKDTLDEYDPVTGLFVPKNSGDYIISSQSQFVSGSWAANGECRQFWYKDIGSTPVLLKRSRRNQRNAITGYRGVDFCSKLNLSAGDEFEVQIYQSSGGSLALDATPGYNWLTIDRIV